MVGCEEQGVRITGTNKCDRSSAWQQRSRWLSLKRFIFLPLSSTVHMTDKTFIVLIVKTYPFSGATTEEFSFFHAFWQHTIQNEKPRGCWFHYHQESSMIRSAASGRISCVKRAPIKHLTYAPILVLWTSELAYGPFPSPRMIVRSFSKSDGSQIQYLKHCHFTSKRLTLSLLLDYHSLLEVTRSRTMQQYGRSEDLTIAKPNIITAFSMTIFLHRKHRLPLQYPCLAGVHPPLKSSNLFRKSPQGWRLLSVLRRAFWNNRRGRASISSSSFDAVLKPGHFF